MIVFMAKMRPNAPTRPPARQANKVRPAGSRSDQMGHSANANNSRRASALNPTAAAEQPVLTWRLLLVSVVGLLAVGLLTPTLRGALEQHQQFSALETEYYDALAESERLDGELARWDDPAFVKSQARTRLSYVTKGDKVWRPIGTELLAEDIDPATGLRVKKGIVGTKKNLPWYSALLESVRVADGPIPEKDEPDDLTAILQTSDD